MCTGQQRGAWVAQDGWPGAWGARTGAHCWADAAKSSQREGGASIVRASEVQPVTARRRREGGGGAAGRGRRAQRPRAPLTRPAGARALAPGWRRKGTPALPLTANDGGRGITLTRSLGFGVPGAPGGRERREAGGALGADLGGRGLCSPRRRDRRAALNLALPGGLLGLLGCRSKPGNTSTQRTAVELTFCCSANVTQRQGFVGRLTLGLGAGRASCSPRLSKGTSARLRVWQGQGLRHQLIFKRVSTANTARSVRGPSVAWLL